MLKRLGMAVLLAAAVVHGGAQAKDKEGKEKDKGTVDVTITAPAAGTGHTAPATITLSASAVSTQASHPIVQVRFYQGASLIGTANQAPYAVNWSNVAAGNYVITAIAANDKGDIGTSEAVTVNVNAPPTVSLALPADGRTFAAPANVIMQAAAADADGSIAKVEFHQNGALLATLTDAPYLYHWANATAGDYALTAKATDNLGGVATSAPVNIKVLANRLPAVSVTATPGTATAPAAIALAATASDPDGTIATVELFHGETLLATLTQPPYSYAWNQVPAGIYAITAKASDNLGGSSVSTAATVNVVTAAAQAYYIQTDHLNTPRVITDGSNNVVWEWKNEDPFGYNLPTSSNGFEFNLRFPGQYFDRETGLHYNYYRDYDPQTGRYIQSDPIGLKGGFNTYAYVDGNPFTRVDPLGLWSMGIEGYIGIGGGINISNDDGTWEVTVRVGVGFGGGLGIDPNAKPSPHAKQCGRGAIGRSSGKASAGIGAGPVGVGGSITAASGNLFTDKVGGGYIDTSTSDTSFERNNGFGGRFGASIGVDLGGYFNTGDD